MKDYGNIYKYILIYVYLLIIIAVLLYRYPSLWEYNKKNTTLKNENIYEEYILGGYLKDKVSFDIDKMYFPIAFSGCKDKWISYVDSYGYERTYGGDRKHEGCDIMTVNNVRGELPVVAVSDGVVEKLGWLELGGYRIGIRTKSGVYYYYAHLYCYEPGIKIGDNVVAGQILGYVGDTGYSKVEGTTGNFDVHLHFGIYLKDIDGNEYTVNPYPLLRKLEDSVINYTFNLSN